MTTSDTTGDKLVASIRRTQTAAAPATDPAAATDQAAPATDQAAPATDQAAPAKPAPRRRVTRDTAKANTPPPVPPPSEARDTYRSIGRVWPD